MAQKDYDFGGEANYAIAKTITCANEEARRLWARGWCFMINYNHEEAIGCFTECGKVDPKCAMAWWGIAYSVSSSYNWSPGLGSGHDPIQHAITLKNGLSELECDLIDALATRHSAAARDAANPAALNMGNCPLLNAKFAEAMAPIHAKYAGNLDVAAVYVEALMNLKPWTLWTKTFPGGTITPADDNTLLIVKTLEDNFKHFEGAKTHPPLCHLYCHALELSPFPERALPMADVLRTCMPDAGHLTHMPSHIDAWVGQWKEGIDCNCAAVAADDKYVAQSGNDSMFYKFYRMHNHHFVVWCAMFDGQYKVAMEYARRMERQLPAGDAKSGVQFMLSGIIPMGAIFLESYLSMVWHVMVRFGKWDDILAEPLRTDAVVFPGTICVQHYARGVAYASKHMVPEAEMERALFKKALENPGLAGRVLHNNKIYQDPKEGPCLLLVSDAILDGEIEYRKQFLAKKAGTASDFSVAFAHIRRGVDLSLGLAYNEPWGQAQPVRHILGALLLEQGHVDEAEAVYREDIKLWKDNMWGLLGLKLCLEAKAGGDSSKDKELADVRTLFAARSARADIVLDKTCFCAQSDADKLPAAGTMSASSCCGGYSNL